MIKRFTNKQMFALYLAEKIANLFLQLNASIYNQVWLYFDKYFWLVVILYIQPWRINVMHRLNPLFKFVSFIFGRPSELHAVIFQGQLSHFRLNFQVFAKAANFMQA